MSDELQNTAANEFSKLLGLYKAEWLDEKLFELFNEPAYFHELQTRRPCVLIGGRGTGKTTVLRGLSYEGQLALSDFDVSKISTWEFYGLYFRVNTNRVTAFRGPEISEDKWIIYFGHYLNLLLCQSVLKFVQWREQKTGEAIELEPSELKKVCATLRIDAITSLKDLAEEIEYLILDFEVAINTIFDHQPETLSMLAAPLDALTSALVSSGALKGKQFFFLIDEFENFEDYQQKIVNTIIKHSTASYTFKIGVRELGWRQRATLNPNEQLTSPADYARLSIAEKLTETRFTTFAENVLRSRMGNKMHSPKELFPSLSDMDEAELLLGKGYVEKNARRLVELNPKLKLETVQGLKAGEMFFIEYWASNPKNGSLKECIDSWFSEPTVWKSRINNHFYASLFAIRSGKRGIRKYYSGWDVFLILSNGNIRYLLELVHLAFLNHLESNPNGTGAISHECQTSAAESIGRKNLSELEGLSVEGGKLTKLLLSLGRVFGVLAENPTGHTPEANQFHLKEDGLTNNSEIDKRVEGLIQHAVMHMALVRFSGNKFGVETDTKSYDYMIHPIFAPFFLFSHRKKRQITLDGGQLLKLIESPRAAIKELLEANNRVESGDLPDQLQLFESFYENN